MMVLWQAIYDEYPNGAVDYCVIRGEDRSTLDVVSSIPADEIEQLNSISESVRRMGEARQEAAYRNALDAGDAIANAINSGPSEI